MAHFAYIIQSESNNKYYIGSSHDPQIRLQRHNKGWTRFTKNRGPWKLVYSKQFDSKSEALKFEKKIKQMKSRSYIDRLIYNAGGRPDP